MNEDAMQKALRECVERLGIHVLTEKTKFKGVIHDLLPGIAYKSERSLLIFAADNLGLGEKALKTPPENEARERAFHYLLKEITESGLTQEAAEAVMRAFALALGWKVKGAAGGAGAAGARPGAGSCAHRNIDFFALRCRDCGQSLYGIFEEDRYTPYEAMRKKERDGVLKSIGDSYGGTFVVPEHITALDDDCFADHDNLQDVILPASLRSIGRYAFDACPALKVLKVPDTVTQIGEAAFQGLKRVYYDGPAAGSPWGAQKHIVSPKSELKPTPQPAPKPTSRPIPAPAPKPAPKPTLPPVPKPILKSDIFASLRAVYADKQVGKRFKFGRYPQGKTGEIEPITWRVLRRDSDSLLVISEYALDAKPYNEKYCSITWSDCTLRRWLNGEFLQKAFNAQEQSLIKTSKLANNAGPDTEDRVFLLSIDEAESLFTEDRSFFYNIFNDIFDRCVGRQTMLTAYAIKNGAYSNDAGGRAWWWLRSRFDFDYRAAGVSDRGHFYSYDVNIASGPVRPAFRIAI